MKKILIQLSDDTHNQLKQIATVKMTSVYRMVPIILSRWVSNEFKWGLQQQNETMCTMESKYTNIATEGANMAILASTKFCKECNETKQLDDFYPHLSGILGRRAVCKRCYCKRQKEWLLAKNPDYYREKYANDVEYREKVKSYQREYHRKKALAKNRDKITLDEEG